MLRQIPFRRIRVHLPERLNQPILQRVSLLFIAGGQLPQRIGAGLAGVAAGLELIDAAKVTASAVADNAWDIGPALPRDLADGLLAELEIVRQQICSAQER